MKDEWAPAPWPPEVRACAVPDVLPAFFLALGAAVVCAALGVWAATKWSKWILGNTTRG
jgi:hypothetical protein